MSDDESGRKHSSLLELIAPLTLAEAVSELLAIVEIPISSLFFIDLAALREPDITPWVYSSYCFPLVGISAEMDGSSIASFIGRFPTLPGPVTIGV